MSTKIDMRDPQAIFDRLAQLKLGSQLRDEERQRLNDLDIAEDSEWDELEAICLYIVRRDSAAGVGQADDPSQPWKTLQYAIVEQNGTVEAIQLSSRNRSPLLHREELTTLGIHNCCNREVILKEAVATFNVDDDIDSKPFQLSTEEALRLAGLDNEIA